MRHRWGVPRATATKKVWHCHKRWSEGGAGKAQGPLQLSLTAPGPPRVHGGIRAGETDQFPNTGKIALELCLTRVLL